MTDLDPQRDLAATLEQAVVAVKQLFAVDAAGSCWPTLSGALGELTLAFGELQIRSGLSVPVQLGGGPIGTLDVYAAAPGGWDATEVSALQTCAGLVATMLGMAAKAQSSDRLAERLRASLDASVLIEQATGVLIEQTIVGLPLPDGRAEPTGAAGDRAPQLDMGALDGEAAAFLEREPGADGIGHKLSLLLLGFLATEVVPPANRLAELGIDPTPLLAASSGVLRLYADTLERPELRR
jgi:hypothetical protein